MRLTVEEALQAIETHTRGLAASAAGRLDVRIEHCPDWSMADLVWHLSEVHRFWEYIARTLPTGEPPERPEFERPADEALIAGLLIGMSTLVDTLRAADQDAGCWTWGLEENVRFIIRHQVQEAAVHHWDALNAVGRAQDWAVDAAAAIDAVEEFLTHSVANRRWPSPDAAPLGGTLWLCPCLADTGPCPAWHVTDGDIPGTLSLSVYDEDAPEITGPAVGAHVDPGTALLWLYGRVPEAGGWITDDEGAGRALLRRFRAFANSD